MVEPILTTYLLATSLVDLLPCFPWEFVDLCCALQHYLSEGVKESEGRATIAVQTIKLQVHSHEIYIGFVIDLKKLEYHSAYLVSCLPQFFSLLW